MEPGDEKKKEGRKGRRGRDHGGERKERGKGNRGGNKWDQRGMVEENKKRI